MSAARALDLKGVVASLPESSQSIGEVTLRPSQEVAFLRTLAQRIQGRWWIENGVLVWYTPPEKSTLVALGDAYWMKLQKLLEQMPPPVRAAVEEGEGVLLDRLPPSLHKEALNFILYDWVTASASEFKARGGRMTQENLCFFLEVRMWAHLPDHLQRGLSLAPYEQATFEPLFYEGREGEMVVRVHRPPVQIETEENQPPLTVSLTPQDLLPILPPDLNKITQEAKRILDASRMTVSSPQVLTFAEAASRLRAATRREVSVDPRAAQRRLLLFHPTTDGNQWVRWVSLATWQQCRAVGDRLHWGEMSGNVIWWPWGGKGREATTVKKQLVGKWLAAAEKRWPPAVVAQVRQWRPLLLEETPVPLSALGESGKAYLQRCERARQNRILVSETEAGKTEKELEPSLQAAPSTATVHFGVTVRGYLKPLKKAPTPVAAGGGERWTVDDQYMQFVGVLW